VLEKTIVPDAGAAVCETGTTTRARADAARAHFTPRTYAAALTVG
jgi:hypothetical protein